MHCDRERRVSGERLNFVCLNILLLFFLAFFNLLVTFLSLTTRFE